MTKQSFHMSQEDYSNMIARLDEARGAPLIMLQCGSPPDIQEVANGLWKELGDRLGFDHMTVEGGHPDGKLWFYAEPVEVLNA